MPPGRLLFMTWFRRPLSVAARLPLLAGLAVFITGATTAQLAMFFMGREAERQSEALADVYLDSLSTAAVQALETGDIRSLQKALERALGFQVGVVDRIIVVGRPDGSILARAGARDAEPPMARGELSNEWEPLNGGRLAWAQREVLQDGTVVALAAVQLAFPDLVERRYGLRLRLGVACVVLAGIAAMLAAGLAQRLMEPILAVARLLEQMATPGSPPRPEREPEASRLQAALEMLLARLREREELAARLAEREKVAVLGRLAATVAHEVRNPLAGMLTAIDTMRRFGNNAAVRAGSLDLVERGLRQIETVVRTTLATQRPQHAARPVTAEDLNDLRVLVQPEARRREVRLDWHVAMPEPFPTDAVQLRQIVLNLLLNAIAATAPQGRVVLRAEWREKELSVQVEDEAGGLPEDATTRLKGDAPPSIGDGLGLEVAARLTAGLQGRISIEARPGGSCIGLLVPMQRVAAA